MSDFLWEPPDTGLPSCQEKGKGWSGVASSGLTSCKGGQTREVLLSDALADAGVLQSHGPR